MLTASKVKLANMPYPGITLYKLGCLCPKRLQRNARCNRRVLHMAIAIWLPYMGPSNALVEKLLIFMFIRISPLRSAPKWDFFPMFINTDVLPLLSYTTVCPIGQYSQQSRGLPSLQHFINSSQVRVSDGTSKKFFFLLTLPTVRP